MKRRPIPWLLVALVVSACTAGTPIPPPAAVTTTEPVETYGQAVVLGVDDVQFFGPNHLAVDADGNLYVTEFSGGRILVFSPDGELIHQWAGGGNEVGQLAGPTGIAVDSDGYVHVGESGTSRVQVFSPEGEPEAVWGGFGVDPGEFGSAMGVGINEELDRVYVADHVNSRIQVFDRSGALQFMFPRNGDFTHIGNEPDQMWLPIGVDLSGDGTVYVVDSGNQRVQTYTPDGEIISVFSTEPLADPQVIAVLDDGSYWVSGPTDDAVAYFDRDGELVTLLPPPPEGFSRPHGIEVTPDGTVWVADTGNDVVRGYRLGSDGTTGPTGPTATTTPSSTETPDVEVDVFSFGYTPPTLTVSVGETVGWWVSSPEPHTVTAPGWFDSGTLELDESFAYTFTEPGTYSYFCSIHGAALQSGVVVVEP